MIETLLTLTDEVDSATLIDRDDYTYTEVHVTHEFAERINESDITVQWQEESPKDVRMCLTL